MRIEAFCTNCHWVNMAYSRIQDVPKNCPECHHATTRAEVRYESDVEGSVRPHREGERTRK